MYSAWLMEEHANKRYDESGNTWKPIDDGWCWKGKIQSLQNERRINDLTKILTTFNNKINKFEAEYKKASDIIMDIENFFDAEKKQLNEYKKKIHYDNSAESGSRKRITSRDICDNGKYIQDTLEEMERNRQCICRNLISLANKFSEEEVRMAYNTKINRFWMLFQNIYDNIKGIAFEQQQLVKKNR
jgi:hypothetical protein